MKSAVTASTPSTLNLPVSQPTLPVREESRYRAADYLADALVNAGVEVVFGIPGGSIGPVYDALLERPSIRVVTTRHECSAVFAAAAYGRVTGKVGVVLVTSGPGVLNAMNGIGSAMADSLPILVIAGEAAREGFGRGAVQEGSSYALNIVAMTSHITKASFELTSAGTAPFMFQQAMRISSTGRPGPVLMSAPLDVLSGHIGRPTLLACKSGEDSVSGAELDTVARTLEAPGRNVILAGSGSRGAAHELRLLAEKLGCPVMTTPKGKGIFPEDHPLALGVFGMGGHPSTSDYVEQGVDVLLAVGTSLNEVATDGWSQALTPRRALLHVDVDATSIGRVYPTDVGIVAPAKIALAALLQRVATKVDSTNTSSGLRYAFDAASMDVVGSEGIAAPRAIWELQACLPADTIYTTDSGTNLFFAIHYLKISHPDAFVSFLGLGSMGSGLPAAVGVQMAAPDRKVVAVLGDGGLAMVAGELSTISELRLPMIIAVLNDQRFGMVEFGMKATFGRAPTFEMTHFDVVGVAKSCGAEAVAIHHVVDIAPAIAAAPSDRPLVLDIRIECGLGLPTNKRFQQITKNTQSLAN
ncbi:MAG: thiamine pyrophosphate-binding protein [Myxococcales bacterium]|nr:thiamine pyrophosphate-binding protein [Myxococcales bacterium]